MTVQDTLIKFSSECAGAPKADVCDEQKKCGGYIKTALDFETACKGGEAYVNLKDALKPLKDAREKDCAAAPRTTVSGALAAIAAGGLAAALWLP